ncbi:hypothetical protein CALCODRAFT_479132 [Calocera cornea HHB12733]|uniref:Ubiquitin-like protease family profile domain-containing protein n=1 Tax=Calocera cornea HHB12733 TaxID=1353952 RepID=A0A165K1K5_9BASI|nr:hypothetical protein CALCODRAFT_479132 [Calocera cornea HHB12733]
MSSRQLQEQHSLQMAQPQSVRTETLSTVESKMQTYRHLQQEIQRLEGSILEARNELARAYGTREATAMVAQLRHTHSTMLSQGEALFASMRIDRSFPEFRGVSSQFLQYLVLARQEKIYVRERIVGHMWELARLRRARGGGHEPIGTKLRDQILKGYGPRWKTTQAAIRRYNTYVDRLREAFSPEWNIPLPLKLSAERLEVPTEDHHLFTDVWWPSVQTPAAWITDERVRQGVTGWLLQAHCEEESVRLDLEGANLVRWWKEEWDALTQAEADADHPADKIWLSRQRVEHSLKRHRWSSLVVQPAVWKEVWAAEQPADRPDGWAEDQGDIHDGEDNESLSAASDPYDRTMGDVDALVEEMGGVMLADGSPDATDTGRGYLSEEVEEEGVADGDAEVSGWRREDNRGLWPARAAQQAPHNRPSVATAPRQLVTDAQILHPDPHFSERWQLYEWKEWYVGERHTRVDIPVVELQRLASPTAWMSEIIVNDFGAMFEAAQPSHWFPESHTDVRVFSSYIETSGRGWADEERWYDRFVSRRVWTETREGGQRRRVYDRMHCWSKPVWIFPRYRADLLHWRLLVVDFESQEVRVYDSMAGVGGWEKDVEDVHAILRRIMRLSRYAGTIEPEDWRTVLVDVRP